MKLTKSVLSAALLVGMSSAAMADFSGFYIGPQVSYTWINTGVMVDHDNVFSTTDNLYSSKSDGFTVGPHLGWAFQVDSWVYALEASYTGGSWTDRNKATFASGDATASDKLEVSQLFTVTPLVGYAFDDWMLYGKAGFASAKIQMDSSLDVSGSETFVSDSQRQNGWTSGLGIAYQFSDKQSIGFEYDYSHLNSTKFTTTSTGAVSVQENATIQPVNINTVSLVYSRYFW